MRFDSDNVSILSCNSPLPACADSDSLECGGVIDNWCDKLSVLFPVLQLVITVGFPVCQKHRIHTGKRERFVSTCNVFLMVLCLLIFGMCLITAISRGSRMLWMFNGDHAGLGFLFAVMGNLMPKIAKLFYRH